MLTLLPSLISRHDRLYHCQSGLGNFGPSSIQHEVEDRNYRWASVDGVSANYDRILNLGIREGRWLNEADNLQRRNVLVIGVSAREALFPNPDESPIGRVVRMNGDTWEVIGVVEKRKSGFFARMRKIKKSSCHTERHESCSAS